MTESELAQRLITVREKAKKARAEEARIKRELVKADRHRSASQKIALGAALMRAVEARPESLESVRRLVLPYITRETDRAALAGTAFGDAA